MHKVDAAHIELGLPLPPLSMSDLYVTDDAVRLHPRNTNIGKSKAPGEIPLSNMKLLSARVD